MSRLFADKEVNHTGGTIRVIILNYLKSMQLFLLFSHFVVPSPPYNLNIKIMETTKTTKTPLRSKVSSAWAELKPAPNKPQTRIISRKEFNTIIQ